MNQHEEAVKAVEQALAKLNQVLFPNDFKSELSPQDYKNSPQSALYIKLYLRRADCYMKLEKFEEAVRDYQALTDLKPGDRGVFCLCSDFHKLFTTTQN